MWALSRDCQDLSKEESVCTPLSALLKEKYHLHRYCRVSHIHI